MALTNSSFLTACRNEVPERIPVWFMRQAGRSLPEYRAIRGPGDILHAISQPDLVAEITLQPVRRYGVDAAILYSDIMVPLAAINFGVEIAPGVGPVISQPFRTSTDLDRLRPLDAHSDTPYVLEAIKLILSELTVPLIGFAGAPFTLAAYLIEGGPSKNYALTKSLMHNDPHLWGQLMDKLAAITISSLRSQVEAGCTAIQLFDSWAGALSPHDYKHFVLPSIKRIFDEIADLQVPTIYFGVATGELLEMMSSAGPSVLGIDWRVPLDKARQRVGNKAVQGNLDPAICLASWNAVQTEADGIVKLGGGKGHIFNLGHGVFPETNPEILTKLVEHVHTFNPAELVNQ